MWGKGWGGGVRHAKHLCAPSVHSRSIRKKDLHQRFYAKMKHATILLRIEWIFFRSSYASMHRVACEVLVYFMRNIGKEKALVWVVRNSSVCTRSVLLSAMRSTQEIDRLHRLTTPLAWRFYLNVRDVIAGARI